MADRICSVAGCGRVHQSRGYCSSHYKRLLRGIDPHGVIVEKSYRGRSVHDRLFAGTVTDDHGCVLRLGGKQTYSRIRYQGRNQMAHRVAWELVHGPIPDDLTVDHLFVVRMIDGRN